MNRRFLSRLMMLLTAAFLIRRWKADRRWTRFGQWRMFWPKEMPMRMNMDFGRILFRVMGNRLMRRLAR